MLDEIMNSLREVFDPEIPLNIVDLGLIYEVNVNGSEVNISMTLTAAGCPASDELMHDVYTAAKSIEGVEKVNIDLTFDPPWTPDRISDAHKLMLGIL